MASKSDSHHSRRASWEWLLAVANRSWRRRHVSLSGEIDIADAECLHGEVISLFEGADGQVVLDLRTAASSIPAGSGPRWSWKEQQAEGERSTLSGVAGEPLRVLELSGLLHSGLFANDRSPRLDVVHAAPRPPRPRGGRCRRSWCFGRRREAPRPPRSQMPPASLPSCPTLPSSDCTTSSTVICSGGPGERVAALDAAMALQQAVATQGREQLLEELHRHAPPLGDLGDRDRPLPGARQLGEGDHRVARLRGDGDHPRPLYRNRRRRKRPLFPPGCRRGRLAAARMGTPAWTVGAVLSGT